MKIFSEKIVMTVCGILFAVIMLALSVMITGHSKEAKAGREVVIFGDSIMAYAQDDSSVAYYIAGITGLDVLDLSFGGTLMSYIYEESTPAMQRNALSMFAISKAFASDDFSWQNSFHTSQPATEYFEDRISEMNRLDLKKTDTVIIGQCINDYHCGIPVGDVSSESEYTYCGAMKLVIRNIRDVNPDVRIIVVSPTKKWLDDGSEALDYDCGGGTLEEYITAQKAVAEYMDAEYISLWDLYDTSMNTLDDGTVTGRGFTVDGTHPNCYARQLISQRIADYLKETDNDSV